MKLLRLPDVETKTGLKHSAIYRLIKLQKFPAPLKQGNGSFWLDDEIDAYLLQMAANRPAGIWSATVPAEQN